MSTINTTNSKSKLEKSTAGKKRGRKPQLVDDKVRVEQSRQSARECRARKKLRYQYTEELITIREKAVFFLRQELATLKDWCKSIDRGQVPPEVLPNILQLKQKWIDAGVLDDDEVKAVSMSADTSVSTCIAAAATRSDSAACSIATQPAATYVIPDLNRLLRQP